MNKHYRQMNLQTLVDLLAEETQRYTKAFVNGTQEEIRRQKTAIHALMAEIRRKESMTGGQEDKIPQLPPNDFFEAAS